MPIEYEQRLLKKGPIDSLNNNIIKSLKAIMLKVSLSERFFDNWMCVSNHQNADFDDLTFDGDERLITTWKIYCINCDIVESLNNGSIYDVYSNQIEEE